jgi:hypothetical protein
MNLVQIGTNEFFPQLIRIAANERHLQSRPYSKRKLGRRDQSAASSELFLSFTRRFFPTVMEAAENHASLWLANCYFAHNSLRFPALLPFFNASSRRPFHPPNRRPDPVVPTWRRPFPRCRVPSSQTPTPDPESLPTPISHSVLVGPHPGRLDDALGPSYSSSPFRNCSEAFYPVL